jgi:hypothetical protein
VYKNLDKIFKSSPARTVDFYNNIISGIVGGGIIYLLALSKIPQTNFLNEISFWI